MQITLSGKEFDKAMASYVTSLGFSTDRYTISTKTIVGRGENPSTTVTIQLDEIDDIDDIPKAISLSEENIKEAEVTVSQTRKFGQGHSDE